MSINNLMILCVEGEYSQEYIANVFWNRNIAQVSDITLIPYLKNNDVYNIAYVTISSWCDSEVAYNFIQRLKQPSKETRLVHYDDLWWSVQINTHNNGNINAGTYTVTFMPEYFVKFTDDHDDEEVFRLTHPIQGVFNDYYTPEEAENRIWHLQQDLSTMDETSDTNVSAVEAEIINLTNELRIHYALENSQNVTKRENTNWAKIYPSDYPVEETDVNEIMCI